MTGYNYRVQYYLSCSSMFTRVAPANKGEHDGTNKSLEKISGEKVARKESKIS